MSEELKECPFCGATATVSEGWVRLSHSKACLLYRDYRSSESWRKDGYLDGLWNRRAMPDVVRELLDAFVNPNIDEMGSGRCIRRQTEAVRAVREYYGEE